MQHDATNHDNFLVERVFRELPGFNESERPELLRILAVLIDAFKPEEIYVFGSTARGEATPDSDVDLLLVVNESTESRVQRAQRAHRAIGLRSISVDVIVLTREEFERRRRVPASLPATVLREGKLLYAA